MAPKRKYKRKAAPKKGKKRPAPKRKAPKRKAKAVKRDAPVKKRSVAKKPTKAGQKRILGSKTWIAHRSDKGNLVWGRPVSKAKARGVAPARQMSAAKKKTYRTHAMALDKGVFGPTMPGQRVTGGRSHPKRASGYKKAKKNTYQGTIGDSIYKSNAANKGSIGIAPRVEGYKYTTAKGYEKI